MAKKSINKKIVTTKTLDLTGTLSLDNLRSFLIEFEDEGEKDVTNLIKELNGEYCSIKIAIKDEKTLDENEPFEKVYDEVEE